MRGFSDVVLTDSQKILILGGTSEAYELAEKLDGLSLPVITSLAGRTINPRLPKGAYRIGGFGGIAGLVAYLKQEKIGLIIDATHPFANQITSHAIAAATATGIAILRLERPLWQPEKGDNWLEVETLQQAVAAIPSNARVFLAIGRQHLSAFSSRNDASFIARMVDLPDPAPHNFQALDIILGKPDTSISEIDFLSRHNIDIIVCRNSGGPTSYGKILAARKLHLPVIMIGRTTPADVTTVSSITQLLAML